MTALDVAREFTRLFGRKLTRSDVGLPEEKVKRPRDTTAKVMQIIQAGESQPTPPQRGALKPLALVCGECRRLIPATGLNPGADMRAHAFGCKERVRLFKHYREHDPAVLADLQRAYTRVQHVLEQVHDKRERTRVALDDTPRNVMEFELALRMAQDETKTHNADIRAQAEILNSIK